MHQTDSRAGLQTDRCGLVQQVQRDASRLTHFFLLLSNQTEKTCAEHIETNTPGKVTLKLLTCPAASGTFCWTRPQACPHVSGGEVMCRH